MTKPRGSLITLCYKFRSGGYKISALDIERTLLGHPKISDVAVVGLEDETWGQKICAVIALKHDNNDSDKTDLTIEEVTERRNGFINHIFHSYSFAAPELVRRKNAFVLQTKRN